MVAPRSDHIRAVTDFIESHGATATAATPNSDMIRTTIPVELAEKMLSTRYSVVHHAKSGTTAHRALAGYSLPAHLASVVDFVAPTVHLPATRAPQVPRSRRDHAEITPTVHLPATRAPHVIISRPGHACRTTHEFCPRQIITH